jgi:predicted PurR-regulated permease PerM
VASTREAGPGQASATREAQEKPARTSAMHDAREKVEHAFDPGDADLAGGVLGAGELVLSAAASLLTVAVLGIYLLVGMPRIKLFVYRLAPQSRRPRVILIGDEIFTKVGGYVLSNFLTSAIAGVGTLIWLLAFGVPYPLLPSLLVALLDLIPVIGSTIGGAGVSLVALTVSLPVAVATLCFYIAYRLAEDYLIVPRIMSRTVEVPAVVTLVAVLIGGTVMGIAGALVAIPAGALRLLLNEVTFRRLDSS